MAKRYIHKQPCAVCGNRQIYVKLIGPENGEEWRVKLPERSMGEAISARNIANVNTYACESCGRLAFYVDDLVNLLE